MWTDPIVDELHKIREEHAKKFHHDLHAIFADFKEKEIQSGRQVIALPIKRKTPQSANGEEQADFKATDPLTRLNSSNGPTAEIDQMLTETEAGRR